MFDTEKRIKAAEEAMVELAIQYAKLERDFTKHVVTPDAHNPGMIARKKQLGK